MTIRVLPLFALVLIACQAAPEPNPTALAHTGEPLAPYRTTMSGGGKYTVKWRPLAAEVPRNEHFRMEVWLYRGADDPLPGVRLHVTGWMPEKSALPPPGQGIRSAAHGSCLDS